MASELKLKRLKMKIMQAYCKRRILQHYMAAVLTPFDRLAKCLALTRRQRTRLAESLSVALPLNASKEEDCEYIATVAQGETKVATMHGAVARVERAVPCASKLLSTSEIVRLADASDDAIKEAILVKKHTNKKNIRFAALGPERIKPSDWQSFVDMVKSRFKWTAKEVGEFSAVELAAIFCRCHPLPAKGYLTTTAPPGPNVYDSTMRSPRAPIDHFLNLLQQLSHRGEIIHVESHMATALLRGQGRSQDCTEYLESVVGHAGNLFAARRLIFFPVPVSTGAIGQLETTGHCHMALVAAVLTPAQKSQKASICYVATSAGHVNAFRDCVPVRMLLRDLHHQWRHFIALNDLAIGRIPVKGTAAYPEASDVALCLHALQLARGTWPTYDGQNAHTARSWIKSLCAKSTYAEVLKVMQMRLSEYIRDLRSNMAQQRRTRVPRAVLDYLRIVLDECKALPEQRGFLMPQVLSTQALNYQTTSSAATM